MRPALHLHISPNPFYLGRVYVWGREFGPVEERSVLLTGARRWGILRSKDIYASLGFAVLSESTTIDYPDGDEFDKSQNQYNAGPLFGVEWVLVSAGALYSSVSWDSHIFAAGATGALFLSYGRKQTVSVTLGARF